MRTTLIVVSIVVIVGCSRRQAQNESPNDSTPAVTETARPSDESSRADASPESEATKSSAATIQPLTAQQQEQLLGMRLDGGMGHSFGQFANMFLVSSRIQTGTGVGLVTSSQEIASRPLQSPFPTSYRPRLREILDALALQTFSEWKYDPSSKHLHSDVAHGAPVEGLAIFEFTNAKRAKPFQVNLAEGWKAVDRGNWVMHVPPSFPVGMDIYEMGTYSTEEQETDQEFANRIRSAVALEWALRVNQNATDEDLKPAKVGTLDALFYESMIPSQLKKDIRWRQWVCMADKKCYFVVSTILPEFEDSIFPDVEKMLASFEIRTE